MRIQRAARSFLSYLLLLSGSAFPQTVTSGTVVGSVTDAAGAVVPNAVVTIQQTESGAVRMTKTNESGQYRFAFLKPGEYVISSEAAGQTTNTSRFNLLVGQEQ
ncbi:MAG: Oar protein [Acidobacteriaceae bacterium]|nr:Oar protein [Acidobacteriaceae bacterium]